MEGSRNPNARRVLMALLAVLLIACGVAWFFRPGKGSGLYAEVTVQGEKVLEIPLEQGDSRTWDLLEDFEVPVCLETDGERIRFMDSQCPDHICVNTGWLSMAYQSAVCMPNRTVVTVYQRT